MGKNPNYPMLFSCYVWNIGNLLKIEFLRHAQANHKTLNKISPRSFFSVGANYHIICRVNYSNLRFRGDIANGPIISNWK